MMAVLVFPCLYYLFEVAGLVALRNVILTFSGTDHAAHILLEVTQHHQLSFYLQAMAKTIGKYRFPDKCMISNFTQVLEYSKNHEIALFTTVCR